jgi:hypothetical protein
MLAQTKHAVDKLKTAGFKRSEFSVQTERIYNGKHPDTGRAMYEYGNAYISFKCSRARQVEMAEAMARAGLHVTFFARENGQYHGPSVTNDHSGQGKIEVIHLHPELKNSWGGNLREVIADYGSK